MYCGRENSIFLHKRNKRIIPAEIFAEIRRNSIAQGREFLNFYTDSEARFRHFYSSRFSDEEASRVGLRRIPIRNRKREYNLVNILPVEIYVHLLFGEMCCTFIGLSVEKRSDKGRTKKREIYLYYFAESSFLLCN